MSNKHLLIAAALMACAGPAIAERGARMSFDQAVSVCTKRAVEFGRQPYGRFAEEPPAYRVQTEYRQCVYANSRTYPNQPVRYRDSILTLLRDAF